MGCYVQSDNDSLFFFRPGLTINTFFSVPQWWFMHLTNNSKIGWMITHDIRSEHMDDGKNSRFSGWEPDAAVEMRNKVRDFESPFVKGGTVGNIVNKTPARNISKVVLEGKVHTNG